MRFALDRAPELRTSYDNSVLLAKRASPIKEFGREWPLQFRPLLHLISSVPQHSPDFFPPGVIPVT